ESPFVHTCACALRWPWSPGCRETIMYVSPSPLRGKLWLTPETHQRLRLIPGRNEDRADLTVGRGTDRHGVRSVNRVRQVHGIMAADGADGHEDLAMMRIIGDPREREPGSHFLVPEIPPNDFYTGVKTVVLLRQVIKKRFPLRLLNVLGHRVSSN